MLALPATDCPQPAKSYTYPICQAQLGRKALAAHLHIVHQAARPSQFPFQADRDMLPGQLACGHCYSVFTMDLSLLTHFRRASYPVLLCDWVKHQHFGAIIECGNHDQPQVPLSPTAIRDGAITDTSQLLLGACDVWTPNTASARVWPCNNWFVPLLSRTPTFLPEHHIRWFVHSTTVCAHLCELPQACFVADQVFRFIDALTAFVPKLWAWTSTNVELEPPDSFTLHDDLESQLQLVAHMLTTIAWALHQERACLTLLLNGDHDIGSGDDRGRSILPGPDPSTWRTLPQEIQDRSLLRWPSSEWPGAAQTIGFDISFLWQTGLFVEDDCKIDITSRRSNQ